MKIKLTPDIGFASECQLFENEPVILAYAGILSMKCSLLKKIKELFLDFLNTTLNAVERSYMEKYWN